MKELDRKVIHIHILYIYTLHERFFKLLRCIAGGLGDDHISKVE